MRSLPFFTALAAAALIASSLAAPAPIPNDGKKRSPPQGAAEAEKKARLRANKYFREPGRTSTLGHYDARYFTEVVSDEERSDTQSHMIRAYLNFFRENDLDTWIAHGSLLGWWWNGKRLPWDFDLDTQVSGATLQQLGDMYNQTRYQYKSVDGKVSREFFLDVNPWIWQRDRGDGMNIIDARWIDVRNGLFIDITGLSEVHPEASPGVWSCKNYHHYKTTELYPMRETMFEGVVAKVPYEYDKILVDEYKETALISTDYHGHLWDPDVKEWVKTQETIKKEEAERKKKEKEAEEKNKAAMKELQDNFQEEPERKVNPTLEMKLDLSKPNVEAPKVEAPKLVAAELKKAGLNDSKPQSINSNGERPQTGHLGEAKLENFRLD